MAYVTYDPSGAVSNISGGAATSASTKSAVAAGIGNVPVPANASTKIGAANTTSPAKVSTPVVSAKAAQDDYTSKLNAFKSLQDQISAQQDAKAKAALEAQATKAQVDLHNSEQNLKEKGLSIQQTQADAAKAAADAKLSAANGLNQNQQTTQTQTNKTPTDAIATNTGQTGTSTTTPAGNTQPTTSGDQTQSKPTVSGDTQAYADHLQTIDDDRAKALSSFLQTSNNLVVGLQQSESALVSATTLSFQSLMASQTQTNAAYTGQIAEAAFRSGGEYTPEISGGIVANAISYGNQKLSELNSKMATTIADLDMNFAKEEYSMINSNFTKLDQSFKDRAQTFKDVHDAISADLKTQNDAKMEKQKFDLEVKKYNLTASTSAIDNKLKLAQISKIYSDMSTADTSAAASWVKNLQNGTAKLSDVPKNLKNAVAAGLANGTPQGVNSILTTTKNAIDDLNKYVDEDHGFKGAVGVKGLSSLFGLKEKPFAGTKAADFDAKLKQVTNDVVLPNLNILHGLGRVTDREFQALQSSITSLSTDLQQDEFKKELKDITDMINKKMAEVAPDVQKDGVKTALTSGYTPDQIVSEYLKDPAKAPNIQKAQQAGYSNKEIIDFYSK